LKATHPASPLLSNMDGEDDKMQEEIWRPVVGYEGFYEVSNLGRVKSIRKNRIMKTPKDKRGYSQLNISDNKKLSHVTVHILVAKAFLGERPNKCHIDHIDGNKTNNCIDNLEYVTAMENLVRGLAKKENQHSRKLGVTWHKQSKKWQSYKRFGGECYYLGSFDDEYLASETYLRMDRESAEKLKNTRIDNKHSKEKCVSYNKSIGYWTYRSKKNCIKTKYFKTEIEAILYKKEIENE
jgi:hypothetical protein